MFNIRCLSISDLRNSMVSLGKSILDVKIIQKILRSLHERFRIKVTTIEESKDLKEMEIEELVGSLPTYEFSQPLVKKAKTIALKASKKKTRVSSEEDSDIDEDVVAMLAKFFGRLMKNEKFKKKFTDRLKKAPKDTEPEEKKDPRGPQCFKCLGYGRIKPECANLKKVKGKAYNATLSDESEKEEETLAEEKFLAFVAPHEEQEDLQSYYYEHSDEDGEELKEAYKVIYMEFLKLKEKHQQQVQELNSLKTEKSTMLVKIQELEEKLLETQLQLERVTNEKLTHMLSIQKCPTDTTELGYVAPSTSNTHSTFKDVFVKPVIPEPPPLCVDKGKAVMEGEVLAITHPPPRSPVRRKPSTCHHCGEIGHIRPRCPHH
jgi:hypothetical protein